MQFICIVQPLTFSPQWQQYTRLWGEMSSMSYYCLRVNTTKRNFYGWAASRPIKNNCLFCRLCLKTSFTLSSSHLCPVFRLSFINIKHWHVNFLCRCLLSSTFQHVSKVSLILSLPMLHLLLATRLLVIGLSTAMPSWVCNASLWDALISFKVYRMKWLDFF